MIRLLTGNVFDKLADLDAASVQCVVTSPPYWGLRSYLPADSPLKPLELGSEKRHDCAGWATGDACGECYVCRMVQVFRGVRRVLRDDGTLWLNLGDSYNGSGGAGGDYSVGGSREGQNKYGGRKVAGLKPKDLVGIPWRVALALQADGWYLRSDIIWHKLAPMPGSQQDRPTSAHEYVFLLTKRSRYFYDGEAVKTPATYAGKVVTLGKKSLSRGTATAQGINPSGNGNATNVTVTDTATLRDVWTLGPEPYSGPHYATFPPTLARLCILAGTSAHGACLACGAPWARVVEKRSTNPWSDKAANGAGSGSKERGYNENHGNGMSHDLGATATTIGWRSTCDCDAGDSIPCTVLDPFFGSGTTGRVCLEEGRDFIGIDLDPRCTAQAQQRIGMFAEVDA